MRISDWSSDVCSSDLRQPSAGFRSAWTTRIFHARAKFLTVAGTGCRVPRFPLRIVTFCPPALAIQNMSPDAPTSPPGGASGLYILGDFSFKKAHDPAL